MRDPKRIKPFLKKLEKAWLEVPDWRFGQLISNLGISGDIFFPEDKVWEEAIDKLLDGEPDDNLGTDVPEQY